MKNHLSSLISSDLITSHLVIKFDHLCLLLFFIYDPSVQSVQWVQFLQPKIQTSNFNCHIGFTVSRFHGLPRMQWSLRLCICRSRLGIKILRPAYYPNLLTQMLQTQLNVMIKQSPQPQLFLLLPGPVQSPSPARPTTCHNHIGFTVSRLPGMEWSLHHRSCRGRSRLGIRILRTYLLTQMLQTQLKVMIKLQTINLLSLSCFCCYRDRFSRLRLQELVRWGWAGLS